MTIAEFVKGLTPVQLAELGSALGQESLPRLKHVMEAFNNVHDQPTRGEFFDDTWTAHHFSVCTASVAARVMQAEDNPPMQMS